MDLTLLCWAESRSLKKKKKANVKNGNRGPALLRLCWGLGQRCVLVTCPVAVGGTDRPGALSRGSLQPACLDRALPALEETTHTFPVLL